MVDSNTTDTEAGAAAPGPEAGQESPSFQAPDFEEVSPGAGGTAAGAEPDIDVILDVPVTLSLEVGRAQMSVGELLRLRVGASEVSLGRRPPVDTSILNALPCRVLGHEPVPPYQVTVLLGLGEAGDGERLLARISRKSWDALGLAEGERVYARVKAVSLT